MISIYKDSIYKDLQQTVMNSEMNINVSSPMKPSELFAQIKKGLVDFPNIGISVSYDYITDNSITEYEAINENGETFSHLIDYKILPINFEVTIALFSIDNINQLIDMESFILNKYSNIQNLLADNPDYVDEKIPFGIVKMESADFTRSKHNCDINGVNEVLYISAINLKCDRTVVSFFKEYPPAQLQLDKNIQLEVIKRGKALEELFNNIESDEVRSKQIMAEKQKILSSLKLIEPMHYSLTDLYKIMTELNCDITKAQNECEKYYASCEEKKRQKEEKIRQINEKYSKQGDEVVNRYTDAIVDNFQKNIKTDFKFTVYGGSTYSEWNRLINQDILEYPNVLVHDLINYTFNSKNYINVSTEGAAISHAYSTSAFPIEYGITINVFAKEENQRDIICEQIKNLYSNTVINIPDPIIRDEYNQIQLVINQNVEIEKVYLEKFKIYRAIICFIKYPNVYYVKEYDSKALENNQKLQLRLTQQAEFVLSCWWKLEKEAITQLKGNYTEFINKKRGLLGAIFDSADLKILKANYREGRPIERGLFEKVFKEIVSLYPDLYDKFIQGWTVTQIETVLVKYRDIFKTQWTMLCDLLNIPERLAGVNSGDARYSKGLLFYIKEMSSDGSCTIDIAIEKFRQYMVIEEEEKRQREAEWAALKEEQGGGFLSSMLDQSIEKSNIKRNVGKRGKRDLIGQAGCAKNDGGNCSQCRLKFSCSRYFF